MDFFPDVGHVCLKTSKVTREWGKNNTTHTLKWFGFNKYFYILILVLNNISTF